jgi:tetratricopeptide (TPR) repeat protein
MKEAVVETGRAVQLAGADASTYMNHALALCQLGRQAEAVDTINQAVRLDPLNAVARAIQARILFFGRRYAESLEAAHRAVLIKPQNKLAASLAAWDLVQLNRLAEASSAVQGLPADDYRRLVAEAIIAHRSGNTAEALARTAGLRKRYGDAANYQYAEIYAQLGDADKATGFLEAAWTKRDSGLASMRVDPFLDPIRADERYRRIETRIFG